MLIHSKNITILLILAYCIFAFSCAQIAPLSGGARDINPPVLLEANPQNYSINTVPKTISIEFDEYIQLKNLNAELSICPPMEEEPDIYVKDKKLIIKIKSELDSNTTYIINLGNSLVDYNEGNLFKSFQYVFSTGSILDSLTVHGKVLDAFNNKPESEVYVFLYDSNNDSLPYKSNPKYYTKTDELGFFEFNYIKEGNYKIFALGEKTGNFVYDSPKEKIAFKSNQIEPFYLAPIVVNDSSALDSIYLDSIYDDSSIIELMMFKEDKLKQFVKNTSINGGKMTIEFSRELADVNTKSFGNDELDYYLKEIDEDEKTASFWLKDNVSDSLSFEVIVEEKVIDTLLISSIEKKSSKDTLVTLTSNVKDNILEYYDSLIITSKVPIDKIDLSKIILINNTDTIADTIIDYIIDFKPFERSFKVLYPFKEKELYTISFMPDAIKDIYKTVNDTTQFMFIGRSGDYYGELSIEINKDSLNIFNRIFQLLDKNDDVVYEISSFDKDNVIFKNLFPQEYTLKIIDDSNCNNNWDTGDYLENIQPEKIYFYPSVIDVGSGWTMDIKY